MNHKKRDRMLAFLQKMNKYMLNFHRKKDLVQQVADFKLKKFKIMDQVKYKLKDIYFSKNENNSIK